MSTMQLVYMADAWLVPWMPQVVGIIRNKYLFKNRPRALISKPAPALPVGKKARTGDAGLRSMFAAPS